MEPHRGFLARCCYSLREIVKHSLREIFNSGDYFAHMNDMLFIFFPNFVVCSTRLVAVATQKFISDIASDSLQYVNPQPH